MYASLFTCGKVASKLFVGCTFCPESVFVLPWDGNEKGYISVKYGVKHDFKMASPEETQ